MFTPAYIRNNNNIIHFLFSQIKLPISDSLLDFKMSSMIEITTIFAFKYNNFLRRARMNFLGSNITFFFFI